VCLGCKAPLGYEVGLQEVRSLSPGPREGTWTIDGERDGAAWKRCGNFDTPAGCNWLVGAEDAAALCRSCRLNRTIPDLGDADNRLWWRRIENAKRLLVAQLLNLGLPVVSKVSEDPERGIMFDFLRAPKEGPRVLTGHADGLITLNIEEADDSVREKIRKEMHEPYRTLLGHLRHESGHYYWDRLVAGTPWLEKFREIFGDEQQDYAGALKRNYEQGARRRTGRSSTSVRMRRSIHGRTGRKAGLIFCIWSTASRRRCDLVCAAKTWSRRWSR
jgi:hypothetical protein